MATDRTEDILSEERDTCLSKDLVAKSDGGDAVQHIMTVHHDRPDFRLAKTAGLYVLFLGVGLSFSSLPPALSLLEVMFKTNVEALGYIMTGGYISYMIGSMSVGLVFDRLNRELYFAVWGLGTSICTSLLLFIPNIYVFSVMNFLRCLALGATDSGAQAYILYLWCGSKYKYPCMQAMHFLWSAGSTLGPLLMRLFIVEETQTNISLNLTSTLDTNGTMTGEKPIYDHEFLKFGFVVVGCYSLLGASIFIAIILFEKSPFLQTRTHNPGDNRLRNVHRKNKRIIVCVVAILLIFSFAMLHAPGAYSAVFVIKGYGWDVKTASILTSALFGGIGIGRIVSIPVSVILKPRTMLICSFVLSTIAWTMLSFFSYRHGSIIWVAIVLSGFAFSPIYPSMLLWISSYLTVNGKVAAVFSSSCGIGRLSSVALTGYMFQNYSHMWMAYIPLIADIICIVLLAVIQVIVTKLVSACEILDTHEIQSLDKEDQKYVKEM